MLFHNSLRLFVPILCECAECCTVASGDNKVPVFNAAAHVQNMLVDHEHAHLSTAAGDCVNPSFHS